MPRTFTKIEPRQKKISTVLLWLVLACLLPGMFGMAFFFNREYSSSRARMEVDRISTARAMVKAVDGQLYRSLASAKVAATFGGFAKHDLAGFHRWAREVIKQTHIGMNFVISDKHGQQLLNTLQEFGSPLPKHGNMAALHRVFATGEPEISGIYIGGLLRKPLMSIDVPVMFHGKVEYVLSMGILPSEFSSILNAQKFPSSWVVTMFDDQGTIVARTLSHEKFAGKPGMTDLVRRINESPEGAEETVTTEGTRVLSIWSRSATTGWSVRIGIPVEEFEQALKLTLTKLASGMVVLLLFGLGLAWALGRKISNSANSLAATAIALAKGESIPEREHRIEIQETNLVADALDAGFQLLEARAQELTAAHRIAGFGFWEWDPKTEEMTGSESLHEIYGRAMPPFAEQRGTLFSQESWEKLNVAMRGALNTGIGFDIDVQAIHSDGRALWLNMKGNPVHDAESGGVTLRGSVLDITQRKQAELELELSRRSYLQELEREVEERTADLRKVNLELEKLARTDALTGLQNRKSANERLRQEFLRLKRSGSTYAVLFMDVDHFKQINDTYGHETGDQVLRKLAAALSSSLRETDFISRFGGEEFLAVLPDTSAEMAMRIAEKLRAAVSEETFPVVKQVTVSVGVTVARGEDKNEDEATQRADRALYDAKESGRNAVRYW